MDEAVPFYRRTLTTSPPASQGVKPMLQLAKTHVFLSEVDEACALYTGHAAQYEDNAFVDMRFGLDHWPLFNVGGGNAPLPPAPGTCACGSRSSSAGMESCHAQPDDK